tara:strand:+ start:1331 stop:1492 length:162 start_codon:yes stop_codon:yes gene_type:complete
MFEVYLIATMACSDAADTIGRMQAHKGVSDAVKAELIEVLQEATPHCSWDAND